MDKFKELFEEYNRTLKLYSDWRHGQRLVNALHVVDGDAYCDLTFEASQPTDCFYDDSKVPALLEALIVRWTNE